MKRSAIIVAGGSGSRMSSTLPKQFLLLKGKPVLMHSIEQFSRACREIDLVIVLPESHFKTWESLCDQYHLDWPHRIVPGGATRFHSVQNALEFIDGTGLVAVHDAARPLVSVTLILSAFECAEKRGNCIPVIPVHESLRQIECEQSSPVDRNRFRLVQTPQIFRAGLLKSAYCQPFREQFTDDATVVESFGEHINLIPGDPVNIKITTPVDLEIAGLILDRA